MMVDKDVERVKAIWIKEDLNGYSTETLLKAITVLKGRDNHIFNDKINLLNTEVIRRKRKEKSWMT